MQRKHLKRIPAAITVAASLIWLTGCRDRQAATSPGPPEVEVVTVEQKDVPIYRDWVGTLESDVNATISAQVTGYLLSRNYQEGSFVTNGQVLFQIDPAPFQATLDQAKSQLFQAQATHEKYALTVNRYRPLAAKEAISQQELDNAVQNEKAAQGHVEAAQAAVKQAQVNLDFTTIRSPVDGIAGLASEKAQIGNLVGPNSGPLTTVATVEPMRVYFSIAQQLMTQLMQRRLSEGKPLRSGEDPGGSGDLQLILASGEMYAESGRFWFANNQVDVKTGTITAVGRFPNPQRLLVSGMFVRVKALLETRQNALLVPQRAVTDVQGRQFVAVVGAENKISVLPVTASETIGTQSVIEGNVKAGDRVVAEGVQKVHDGMVVKPVPFVEKSPPAGSSTTNVTAEAKL